MVQRSDHRALAVGAIAVTIVSIVYWLHFSNGGLGSLSYDSFRYLAGAESFAAHGTYLDLDGTRQHVWPPGTSFLYAVVSRLSGQSTEALVPAIDLAAMLLALIAFWRLLSLSGVRWWIGVAAFAAFAWNGIFLSAATKLWSDPIALAFLLVIFWFLLEDNPRFFVAANALAVLAVTFRFAMLASVALLLAAALFRRRLVWLPFVTGALMLLFVMSQRGGSGGMHALQLRANWEAFAELTRQMVPSVIVVLLVAVVLPLLFARRALGVVLGLTWLVSYGAFLVAAQAVTSPSFTTDLRILFPLYPALLLSSALAAEQGSNRFVSIAITIVIAIGALRGAHYVAGSLRSKPGSATCVSREVLLADVRVAAGRASSVVTNAQGLVWFALRRPVFRLGRDATPPGAVILWIDPAIACPSSVDDPAPRQGIVIPLAGNRGPV